MKLEKMIPTFLEDFEQKSKMVKNYVSLNTLKAYKLNLDMFHRYLIENNKGTSLNVINERDIVQFINNLIEQGKSPSTRNQIVSTLKSLHRFARKKYKLQNNPFIEIQSAYQKRKEAKYISDEDYEYLLAEIDKKGGIDQIIFRVLLQSGIRASELIGLNNNDVVFENGHMIIKIMNGKGNKSRELPFVVTNEDGTENKENLKLRNFLKTLINSNKKETPNEKALFVSNFKKRLSYQGLNAKYKRWMKKLKLAEKNYTLHSCRHTMVRRLQKKGVGLHIIQAICGHSDPTVTQRVYGTHVTVEDIAKENKF